MKTALTLVLMTAFALGSSAQHNIVELGHLDYDSLHGSDLANLWGYADEEGNEYALVGVNGSGVPNSGGLSVVDVTDPANPVEVFFAPGPNSIWREVKVWGDHAYVTTEANFGLQIVDLSPLPHSTELPVTVFQGQGWSTAHSLFIDENGRLYVQGTNRGNGGVIMYDLTQDPEVPVEVGSYDPVYCHDSFARGDTLYAAHIYQGTFSIVDVSDPAAPVMLGSHASPAQFTHNLWLDDTGRYLFSTDEVSNAYVAAYDISDPLDIREVDRIQSDAGNNVIPHNTYWLNGFLVTSYYTYGVVIYDATHPENLVEVGHFDTSPFTGSGFHGDWGVYPYLPSGNLLISDMEGGLYILGATYVHASWLQGVITDAATGNAVYHATITLESTASSDSTGFDGLYALGTDMPGPYTVTVSAAGYPTATIPGVVLESGVVTVLDVALGESGSTGLGERSGHPIASIVPNPCSESFTLEMAGTADVTVQVVDMQGREVMRSFRVVGAVNVPVKGLVPGVYFLRISGPGGQASVQRLLVQ